LGIFVAIVGVGNAFDELGNEDADGGAAFGGGDLRGG
jgi:hypothetical protein